MNNIKRIIEMSSQVCFQEKEKQLTFLNEILSKDQTSPNCD